MIQVLYFLFFFILHCRRFQIYSPYKVFFWSMNSRSRYSCPKEFNKNRICCKIHRKTPVSESLFNKLLGCSSTTLSKRDLGTSVFLWIEENISGCCFYRTPTDNYFRKTSPAVNQNIFWWTFLRHWKERLSYSLVLLRLTILTHLFPIHPFSIPWKHQTTLEKGCNGNK